MLGRIFEGYGFLLINLSAPVLLTLHTKNQNRGKVMGIWGSFMPAGNALIILIAPFVFIISDWWLFWQISAVFTISFFFLAYFIIPSDPQHFKESLSEKLTFILFKIIRKKYYYYWVNFCLSLFNFSWEYAIFTLLLRAYNWIFSYLLIWPRNILFS